MIQCSEVRKNTYYDSVTLMLINKEIMKLVGVKEVIVGMGTELNKELARSLSLRDIKINGLTPNDFFIALGLDDEANINLETIVKKVDELLDSKRDDLGIEYKPNTLKGAVKHSIDANLAIISLPGKYAVDEVKKALNNNLHVMLFSDNIGIEEEIELKKLGRAKGLLVMGPDCGTAIINGIPLCFANVVKRGNIGVVAASGTGTQEVTVIIDRLGCGVSQVIGTGGRDLKSEVGGIMMIEGFKALIDDPSTKVIVLISKPPAKEVAEKILNMVKNTNKPVVVDFIGGDRALIERTGAYPCVSLEDAAHKAVELSKGETVNDFSGFTLTEGEVNELIERELIKFTAGQKYLRALYTGGTLADEAMKLLSKLGYQIYSNIPLSTDLRLQNIGESVMHTCIDLGDDAYTQGKPHPMIDPSCRIERLTKESMEDEVAIVLMDFVLGYGSNMDPAQAMIPSIIKGKKNMETRGKYLCVIGCICGTENDPQNYMEQKQKLENVGVIIMPSNAQAVKICEKILSNLNKVR